MAQFRSNENPMFRSKFSEDIFKHKYAHTGCETWSSLASVLVEDVCQDKMSKEDKTTLSNYITELKFIPGGRYLYYAGRLNKFFNNCYLLCAEEDTREDWANLSWKAESCLMTGGGIGVDYSIYREEGRLLAGTGGLSSGPIPKMQMLNEIGRRVMQGGSRRSAIYASLNWKHADVSKFLECKNWYETPVGNTGFSLGQLKEQDFNFPAPLDMTNISVNYDTDWLLNYWNTGDVGEIFKKNVAQALKTAEPGFSFNFFEKENETLRNACTEVTANNCFAADGGDDSDVCNLGSLNLGRIETLQELNDITELATKFLLCGTLRAKLPYDKVYKVRDKNRRLGLGLMGIHEWLIKRGYKYEVTEELHQWLSVYKGKSGSVSKETADKFNISRPVANRAIAPTGSIGILAGTSTGVEPIFAVSYKRRYLKGGTRWHYQYVVDSAAQELINLYGIDPSNIESALDLADDYKRRIKFQADVQDYVDMSISSTINLPAWGSKLNNEDTVDDFTNTLASYASRLRGFTVYPDASRGGQPLTSVPYSEAVDKLGEEFEEGVETHDICDITGHGGSCGV
jgi:ribonucleoside-diphosphate reductase alpha chain|tara:strand:+ start:2345 stop:4054 length:1710 start_codon:yes stop_codon:yes gene_type:complete